MKFAWSKGLVVAAAMIVSAPASADVVVHIDKSSQRMAVSVDGAARYNWPVRPAAVVMARRTASSARKRWYGVISRANITTRRCRTRSSSTTALRFTAPASSRGSVAPPRWSSAAARTTRASRSTRAGMIPAPASLLTRAPARPAGWPPQPVNSHNRIACAREWQRYDSSYADLGVRDAEIAAHAAFRKRLHDHDVVPEAQAAAAALS
jgi:hypothetical protein